MTEKEEDYRESRHLSIFDPTNIETGALLSFGGRDRNTQNGPIRLSSGILSPFSFFKADTGFPNIRSPVMSPAPLAKNISKRKNTQDEYNQFLGQKTHAFANLEVTTTGTFFFFPAGFPLLSPLLRGLLRRRAADRRSFFPFPSSLLLPFLSVSTAAYLGHLF